MLLKDIKTIKNKNVDITKIISNNKILWEGKERLANGTYTFQASEFTVSDNEYEKNYVLRKPFSSYNPRRGDIDIRVTGSSLASFSHTQDDKGVYIDAVPNGTNRWKITNGYVTGLFLNFYGNSNSATLTSVTVTIS